MKQIITILLLLQSLQLCAQTNPPPATYKKIHFTYEWRSKYRIAKEGVY